MGQHSEIAIIGAGMAGLACANELSAAGHSVRVIDKGRGPGGRMSTRRAEVAGAVVSFDHGAQYFTARDEGFSEQVHKWEDLGVVGRWPEAGDDVWVGIPGMNGPIRAMARHVPVDWATRAETIARDSGRWKIVVGRGAVTADILLLAIPAEQAEELLREAAPNLAAIAAGANSEPCWTAMVAFARRLDLPDTIRSGEGSVSWAARNSAKPQRNGAECWVLQASPQRSRELLDMPKEAVGPLLIDEFFTQTGAEPAAPIHLTAHRWLYAMARPQEGEPARYDPEARIGIAGDYLHSPRVEGAWLSGRALAQSVLGAV